MLHLLLEQLEPSEDFSLLVRARVESSKSHARKFPRGSARLGSLPQQNPTRSSRHVVVANHSPLSWETVRKDEKGVTWLPLGG